MPNVAAVESPILRQNIWNLEEVLPLGYTWPAHYRQQAPKGVIANFIILLSRDVFSEGDAQLLYDYLETRQSELSTAFQAMLRLWLRDELKHFEALRRVYHAISGTSFSEMNDIFQARMHEIQPIQPVLVDEFTILVTFMFDEIGSVYSYRRDLLEYYGHCGPEIQKVGHYLVKDEGLHFHNAAQLLLGFHAHRLKEVPDLLVDIARLETRLGKYYKTFFLDHAQEQFRFPNKFNSLIIQVVLAKLGLGQPPPAEQLRELWQPLVT
jgi:rubrerythrin